MLPFLVDLRTQPRCVHMQETYKIEKRDWAATLMAVVVVVTMVTSTHSYCLHQRASARTDNDDSYGYTFKDSSESDGPTYSWTDIVSTGTIITWQYDRWRAKVHLISDLILNFTKQLIRNSTMEETMDIFHLEALLLTWTPYSIPSTQLQPDSIIAGWFDGGFLYHSEILTLVFIMKLSEMKDLRKLIIQMQDQVYWSARQGSSTVALEMHGQPTQLLGKLF